MMFISMIRTCINKIEILRGAVYELFNCKVEHFLLVVCYIDAIRDPAGAASSSSVVDCYTKLCTCAYDANLGSVQQSLSKVSICAHQRVHA